MRRREFITSRIPLPRSTSLSSTASRRPFARARNFPLGTAFKTALHLAAKSDSSHVSAFLPGASDVALSIAVDHGMRITFPMVLVSTHDFGNWAQYLPRNPGFM
jgi:hypothetical protein